MTSEGTRGLTGLFIAELNERLFVHFTQGRWCAPLSDRLYPSRAFDGQRMGRIACAGQADIDRALSGLDARCLPSGDAVTAYDRVRPLLRALRRLEESDDPVCGPVVPSELPTGQEPLILLSSETAHASVLAGVLIAGSPRGILWKPAPRAAASAHLLMRTIGPLAGGGLVLLHGDHATGSALAGRGALLWVSDSAPPASLQPALTLSATPRPRP